MLPLPIASERREKAGLSKGKAGGAIPGSSAQQKSGHEAQSIGAAVEWENRSERAYPANFRLLSVRLDSSSMS
jgi:hypothetical protein